MQIAFYDLDADVYQRANGLVGMVSDLDTSVRMRPCSRESRLLAFLNLQERNKGDCIMTELLKAIGKHVARRNA